MFFRLCLLFLTLPIHATVFQMHPVDHQIKEADGIIIGHYLRKKSVKLEDGSIATQMIFKMNKETGMQSELFGMNEVIVHYPGGKVGEEFVKVDGVPEFIPGEHVVLMIKSSPDRYWGMNLGFGTFKVINYGNEKMIMNTLFPQDRRVSQVKLEDFERSIKIIKGSGLKVVAAPVYPTTGDGEVEGRKPASFEGGKNRAIASKTEEEENNPGPGFNSMWLVFILAAMGAIFRLLRQKEAK